MREAYQSQLAIQQNQLMKLFTVVTVVFLPLTLLTGWYGMNFVGMPELTWKYGYPVAIVVSVVIVVALLRHFKKKNWLMTALASPGTRKGHEKGGTAVWFPSASSLAELS